MNSDDLTPPRVGDTPRFWGALERSLMGAVVELHRRRRNARRAAGFGTTLAMILGGVLFATTLIGPTARPGLPYNPGASKIVLDGGHVVEVVEVAAEEPEAVIVAGLGRYDMTRALREQGFDLLITRRAVATPEQVVVTIRYPGGGTLTATGRLTTTDGITGPLVLIVPSILQTGASAPA